MLRTSLTAVVIAVGDVDVVHLVPTTRHQSPGALAVVDVVDDQHVQDLASRTPGGAQLHDLRIGDGEGRELLDHPSVQDELVAVPEVRVVAHDLRQLQQERRLDERCAVLVGDTTDAEARVDDLEEQTRVLDEVVPAHVVVDLAQTVGQVGDVGRPTGTSMTVQHRGRLDEGVGRDELSTLHVLVPRDQLVEDEVLVRRQLVQALHRRHLVLEVPQGDVRAEPGLTQVEPLEHLLLRLLGGVEVDGRTEVRPHLRVGLHRTHRSGHPLQSVDDEHLVAEVQHSLSGGVVLTAHAEHDVRDATVGDGSLQLPHLGVVHGLALVGVDLEVDERVTPDHATQNDVPRGGLVERTADDLDAGSIGCSRHLADLSSLGHCSLYGVALGVKVHQIFWRSETPSPCMRFVHLPMAARLP